MSEGSSALPSSAAAASARRGASGSSVLRLISSARPCAYHQPRFSHVKGQYDFEKVGSFTEDVA